jgi:mRNA-degrading endonuclease RelE of RelBE toxin-antitoxin system
VKTERQIIFHGEYFISFYLDQPGQLQNKIEYILKLIKTVEKIPEKFLKHIEGTEGLFEIRIEFKSNAYRIFCCFDEGNIVVLFNVFQKKHKRHRQERSIWQKN